MAELAMVGAGMAVAGGLIGALGAHQEGQAKAAAANFNAAIASRNAAISLEQASQNAKAQDREARKTLGSMRAGYGASGVTAEGSPLDVIEASHATAELDKQNILYQGRLRAMAYRDEEQLSRFEAVTARQQAIYKSASALLQGGGQAAVIGTSRLNLQGSSPTT